MIAIIIFLIIQTALISGLLYLKWKETPLEVKQEIKRKIQPLETEVKEWAAPKSAEEIAAEEVFKKIHNA